MPRAQWEGSRWRSKDEGTSEALGLRRRRRRWLGRTWTSRDAANRDPRDSGLRTLVSPSRIQRVEAGECGPCSRQGHNRSAEVDRRLLQCRAAASSRNAARAGCALLGGGAPRQAGEHRPILCRHPARRRSSAAGASRPVAAAPHHQLPAKTSHRLQEKRSSAASATCGPTPSVSTDAPRLFRLKYPSGRTPMPRHTASVRTTAPWSPGGHHPSVNPKWWQTRRRAAFSSPRPRRPRRPMRRPPSALITTPPARRPM